MKILVTGATGFNGGHLIREAAQLGEVIAIQRSDNGLRDIPVAIADLRDKETVKSLFESYRPEIVLHTAARIPQSAIDDIYTFFDDNVTATTNLYHSASRTGVRRIVFSSTMSVYGAPQSLPVREDHPLVPDLPYSLSKIQAELIAHCFAESGLETTILRYSGVFGKGQKSGAVPAFIARCLMGAPLTLNACGRPSSDFVWVDDVVQANLLAIQYTQQATLEVMNIGSGTELTVMQLAEKIRALCGSQSPIVPVDGPSPRDIRYAYDITRAREKLGYNPTSMDVALKECIRQSPNSQ